MLISNFQSFIRGLHDTSSLREDKPDCIFFHARWISNVPFHPDHWDLMKVQPRSNTQLLIIQIYALDSCIQILIPSSRQIPQTVQSSSSYNLRPGTLTVPAQYGEDNRDGVSIADRMHSSPILLKTIAKVIDVQKIIQTRKETQCTLIIALHAVAVCSCLAIAN